MASRLGIDDRAAAVRTLRSLWRAMPEGVRTAPAAQAGLGLARRVTRRAVAPPPRVITTLAELDECLAMLEEAVRISDDALRAGFASFRMEVDRPMPPDPFSDGYRDAVLEMYDWLHGGPYALANEMTPFDHRSAVVRPFPFLTGSPYTTGDHLIAIGHLIRTAAVGSGARVLELGAGWGNVALFLAQLGAVVTTLDISAEFVALIEDRAAALGVEVEARTGDFLSVAGMDRTFDAVLFFESFHHCLDHQRLLGELDRIVAPGGRIVFGAEPVALDFWCPWGLRLDGESVWAIRRNGWLELGFRRDYFRQVLGRAGWHVDLFVCPDAPAGQVWVATRGDDR